MPELPHFRFHPAPLATGSVVPHTGACSVCGQARGFCYDGPVFGERGVEGSVCPWCIAEGRAYADRGATFVDLDLPEAVTSADRDELEQRTPGFDTVNPFEWPACCGAPMAYQEPAGCAEIRARHRDLEGELMATIVHDLGRSGGSALALFASLHRDAAPTAHVFGCPACGRRQACLDLP